jgi:hypothetical protein
MHDYYEILQVSGRADHEVIKAAYKRLAFKHHPDRNPGDTSAEKVMKGLNEAWEILGEPSARSAYDGMIEVEAALRAEPKREVATGGEKRSKQTKRADINAPRTGNNSGSHKQYKSSDLVDAVAVLIAIVGGIFVYLGAAGALSNLEENRNNEWQPLLFAFVGGAMALAEAHGLKFRKFWAISIALWLCMAATFGQGLLFVSNWSNTPPWAIFPFAFLLAADLFFMSVRSQWKKQHPSLR